MKSVPESLIVKNFRNTADWLDVEEFKFKRNGEWYGLSMDCDNLSYTKYHIENDIVIAVSQITGHSLDEIAAYIESKCTYRIPNETKPTIS